MKSYILLILLFVVACNNDSESSLNSKFADRPHVELVAEKISVDELLEPGFVVRTDDYLIYFGESGKNRDLFYVYTTDESFSFGDDSFVFEDKNPNFKDMMIYNGYMRHDDGYLAVTRVGREHMKMSPLNPLRDFRFNIEIYDRDLTPIALLKPGQNILRFEIDIDRGYIYSWDVLNGFEHICRYKIDIKQL